MFTIRLAGQAYSIDNHYDYIEKMCRDYQFDGPGIPVSVTEEEILKENHSPGGFPPEYLESLAVYRRIATLALKRGTLLFHGSAIAVDKEGFLFTAASGTGKSTHTALWRKLFGNRAVMINDDKPLLRIEEDRVYVCGTPWDGKHHLSTNTEVPLRALCILERGAQNTIRPEAFRDAYPMLLQQCFHPEGREDTKKMLQLIDRLGGLTELYRLRCNMDVSAAAVAYQGMTGETICD